MDSSDEDDLDPVAAERRQRAMQLLAKVLNKRPAADAAASGGGDGGSAAASKADADAEAAFLRTLLDDLKAGVPANRISRSVRDRLTVLGVQRGGVQVAATKKAPSATAAADAGAKVDDDDDDGDDDDDDTAAAPKRLLPDALQRLRDGDVSAVSSRVRTATFWREVAGDCLAASAGEATPARAELPIPSEELDAMRASVQARGYGVVQPSPGAWGWGEQLTGTLAGLRAAAEAFRAAGWPPAFIFTLDEAWAVLDQIWAPMEALLGPGCGMDPSVFCWIASRPPAPSAEQPKAPPPKAGANFGVPHRDFTCLQSLRKSDGAPAVVSVWLPLNDVTPENGCMMLVPRQLDAHFTKRWAYAHMRPALPPDADEADGPTEVRFNLAAAKPLAPLAAGSIAAWVGNLIHWGTCCLPDAPTAARASVGFNFLAEGERLQSTAPMLTRAMARELDIDGRLALIARSLLAYSPWYALSDDAVPAAFFAETPTDGETR